MNSGRCMLGLFVVVLCGAHVALATEVEGRLALPGNYRGVLLIFMKQVPWGSDGSSPSQHSPDLSAKDAQLVLALETGSSLRTYPLPGGKFAFHNVPAGKHYLDVDVLGLVFPTLELTVFADGEIHAVHSDLPGRPSTPYPVLVRPAGKMEYFEVGLLCKYWRLLLPQECTQ